LAGSKEVTGGKDGAREIKKLINYFLRVSLWVYQIINCDFQPLFGRFALNSVRLWPILKELRPEKVLWIVEKSLFNYFSPGAVVWQ
jgi:hypothetical protein